MKLFKLFRLKKSAIKAWFEKYLFPLDLKYLSIIEVIIHIVVFFLIFNFYDVWNRMGTIFIDVSSIERYNTNKKADSAYHICSDIDIVLPMSKNCFPQFYYDTIYEYSNIVPERFSIASQISTSTCKNNLIKEKGYVNVMYIITERLKKDSIYNFNFIDWKTYYYYNGQDYVQHLDSIMEVSRKDVNRFKFTTTLSYTRYYSDVPYSSIKSNEIINNSRIVYVNGGEVRPYVHNIRSIGGMETVKLAYYNYAYISNNHWHTAILNSTTTKESLFYEVSPGLSGSCDNLGIPSFWSFYDISQSYININLHLHKVDSCSLNISFIGACNFSDMYPKPDYTDMSSIRFYQKDKIKYICEHGLWFHSSFPEMQTVQNFRLFCMAAIFSAIFAAIINMSLFVLMWMFRSLRYLFGAHNNKILALPKHTNKESDD